MHLHYFTTYACKELRASSFYLISFYLLNASMMPGILNKLSDFILIIGRHHHLHFVKADNSYIWSWAPNSMDSTSNLTWPNRSTNFLPQICFLSLRWPAPQPSCSSRKPRFSSFPHLPHSVCREVLPAPPPDVNTMFVHLTSDSWASAITLYTVLPPSFVFSLQGTSAVGH